MASSSFQALADIVSTLGGPEINTADVEWVTDIPAGRTLIDWVASQVEMTPEDEAGRDETEDHRRIRYQAALSQIALENEEVELINHVKLSSKPSAKSSEQEDAGLTFVPLGYEPPSRLKKRAEFISNETQLLEVETQLLKSRYLLAKAEIQKMSQKLKSLNTAIAEKTRISKDSESRLAELSLGADTSISSSVNKAQSLLGTISSQHMELANATSALANLASARFNLTASTQKESQQIQQAINKKLLDKSDVESEALRLEAALDNVDLGMAEEVAYLEELDRIRSELENNPTALDELLREYEFGLKADEAASADVNPSEELEKSWILDQAEALDLQIKFLEKTITSLHQTLLSPLTSLHSYLTTLDEQIHEAEALFGALGEELEDVVDDVRFAQNSANRVDSGGGGGIHTMEDELLERELISVFKESKDMRALDAPPLVLLGKQDVIAELNALVGRERSIQQAQEIWSSKLLESLTNLNSSHQPFLAEYYAHSKITSSPPFRFPSEIEELESTARRKLDDLSTLLLQRQKEVDATFENSRVKRKLGAFVDKWASSS